MQIINEDIQMIHIGPRTQLSLSAINYALLRASANKMYARFYTDNNYIQVNFLKDGKIAVSSNIRNPAFINSLWRNDRQGWTFNQVKNFVYQWMQLSRRIIY